MPYRLSALILILTILSRSQPVHASEISASQTGAPQVFLGFEQFASGLSHPVEITHAGDGTGRLFIVEQNGQVIIHDGMQILPMPFLDLSSVITSGGESGLLGIAFHPNYKTNGRFFVNYTRTHNGQLQTAIASYQVSANPNIADNTSGVILLTIDQPAVNHNGGQLRFGPDGYLYIGMGDGGGSGDPFNQAQDPDSLLGKMLRIDVDSGSPYGIPPDNPFIANPNVRDEIWAFGLRNPWRFSFDRLTGDLFIADVGQNEWEEVNVQPASSPGGENYNWPCMEANHIYDAGRGCDDYGASTNPQIEYAYQPNDSNGCSITGGFIYRGTQFPLLYGTYLYGDFCTGNIWAAAPSGSTWTSSLAADTDYSISAFGEDEEGELYVASYGTGTIYHISASRFADVSHPHWAWEYIESLYNSGVTSGCSANPLAYCPQRSVKRAEMAIFLLRGIHGSGYTPPSATGTVFDDIPLDSFASAWIEQLFAEGITSGCHAYNYCPNNPITRAQMAVFLLRAKYGSAYTPPAASGTVFNDVPLGSFADAWIEQLAAEGITSGCGGGNYCPNAVINRAQMAVFLVRTFNLPLP